MGYDVTKFFELCFVCIWFKALYRGPAGVNPFSLARPLNWPKQDKIELAVYWPGPSNQPNYPTTFKASERANRNSVCKVKSC